MISNISIKNNYKKTIKFSKLRYFSIFLIFLIIFILFSNINLAFNTPFLNNILNITPEAIKGIINNENGTQTFEKWNNQEINYTPGEVRILIEKNKENGKYTRPEGIHELIAKHDGKIIEELDWEKYITINLEVPIGNEIKFMKEISKSELIKYTSLNAIYYND